MGISAFPIACKTAGFRIAAHFYAKRAFYMLLQALHTFACCALSDMSVILGL